MTTVRMRFLTGCEINHAIPSLPPCKLKPAVLAFVGQVSTTATVSVLCRKHARALAAYARSKAKVEAAR